MQIKYFLFVLVLQQTLTATASPIIIASILAANQNQNKKYRKAPKTKAKSTPLTDLDKAKRKTQQIYIATYKNTKEQTNLLHTQYENLLEELFVFIETNPQDIYLLKKQKLDTIIKKTGEELLNISKKRLEEIWDQYRPTEINFEGIELSQEEKLILEKQVEKNTIYLIENFNAAQNIYDNLYSKLIRLKEAMLDDAIEIETLRQKGEIKVTKGFYSLKDYELKQRLWSAPIYKLKKNLR
jgi:hypothetical protein